MNKTIPNKIIRYIKEADYRILVNAGHGAYNNLTDEEFLKKVFKSRLGYELNLDDPKTFNEKMQWLKLYNRDARYVPLVDKYQVKQYVAEEIGDKYIIPTIGVWDSPEQIDFSRLPDQFVLKCNHNSGKGLCICRNKDEINEKKVVKELNKGIHEDYFLTGREWPYRDVPRKIIAEGYLENNEEGLHDYKVWCFNGEPVYIQYITGRIGDSTYEGFYDPNWELQNFSYHNPLMKEPVKRPDCLEELIRVARELAKHQPFVRTDFYVLEDGSIRFGEITFYPMSGMEPWHPAEMDRILGDMIDLYFGR